MSLMKLLSVSKSFAGGRSSLGRYKMAEQGLLPKFAPVGRAVSLAPQRKSDQVASRQEPNGMTVPSSSLQQQSFNAPQTVAEPAKTFVPSARSAVCVNANATPTDWCRLGKKPLVNRLGGRSKPPGPAQFELSLDAVKPVRNDLSDSDLQIVPAKPAVNPDALKSNPASWLRPELTGLAWSRLTARFFNS